MKKIKFIPLSLVVLCVATVLAYNNCGKCGTNTGNPFGGCSAAGVSPPQASPSQNIADIACLKISSCYPIDFGTCRTNLDTAKNFSSALGLDASEFPNFSSVSTGVNSGLIKINGEKQTSCFAAVNALFCSDPLVTSAYNISKPSNLNKAYMLLQADMSCLQIYSK